MYVCSKSSICYAIYIKWKKFKYTTVKQIYSIQNKKNNDDSTYCIKWSHNNSTENKSTEGLEIESAINKKLQAVNNHINRLTHNWFVTSFIYYTCCWKHCKLYISFKNKFFENVGKYRNPEQSYDKSFDSFLILLDFFNKIQHAWFKYTNVTPPFSSK